MKKSLISFVKTIHFVGIGGIGMSGLAEILHQQGFEVTGSDLKSSENTDYLKNLGLKIEIGHKPENIGNAEVVVYSSAVDPNNNPETIEAKLRGVPVLRRAEMLAEITRLSYTIAISGTHGKTTTTSLCGLLLINAGFDPTVIVGGRLRSLGGTNTRLGKGNWTVVEADEYDRSFLQLLPTIALVNNIEPEHLDIYKNFEELKDAFIEFLNKVPFYGFIIAGIDDPGVKDILSSLKRKVVTFGLSSFADVRAKEISFSQRQTYFYAFYKENYLGEFILNIPGTHNVQNALAAIALGCELGIDIKKIKESLSEFSGVNRRFEVISEKNGVMIVDDYAHHPSEIVATLKAAKDGWGKRIVAIFQPHTYTRTQAFYKEFGEALNFADVIIVTEIYPAREEPIEGVSGKLVVDTIKHLGHPNVHFIKDLGEIAQFVKTLVEDNDIVITLGAGNIWTVAQSLSEIL